MDLARDRLDELDDPSELVVADALAPDTKADAATEATTADDEPVLGPLGRRLLTLGVIAGVVMLIIVLVWLLGMLAYTTPPVPGSG